MNIIVGGLMLWLAYMHVRDGIDPNRQTRQRVRWNSFSLALVLGFLGLVFLGIIGPGPA